MVVDFQLGRLENTAPVHKSELRKCVDFLGAWGSLWDAFCDLFGVFGGPLGHLGVPLGILLVTLGLLWRHFGAHGVLMGASGGQSCQNLIHL